MKSYKKAYALASLCVLFALFGLAVPSDGAGLALAPLFLILALVAAGFGVVGQFGSPEKREWVENNW